jgi:2'-5' RNA ligase
LVRSKEDYQAVWNQFLFSRRTLRTTKRNYSQWHKGRKEYAAWTIGVQSDSVQSRFDAGRAQLAKFLLEPYRRQPHVTLFVCGFLTEIERFEDDYTSGKLKCHLKELQEGGIAAFEIKIGGINSFAAAPFLEVFDIAAGIQRIRDILAITHSEIRTGEYVPHLTLGLYSDHFETSEVAQTVSSFGPAFPITHFVDEISLITYSAFEIAGPLEVKYRIALEQR